MAVNTLIYPTDLFSNQPADISQTYLSHHRQLVFRFVLIYDIGLCMYINNPLLGMNMTTVYVL